MANRPRLRRCGRYSPTRNPTLGVGCHIVLTDGIPVSPPHEQIAARSSHRTHHWTQRHRTRFQNTSIPRSSTSSKPSCAASIAPAEDILHRSRSPRSKSSSAQASASPTSTPTNTPTSSPRVARCQSSGPCGESPASPPSAIPFEPAWSLDLQPRQPPAPPRCQNASNSPALSTSTPSLKSFMPQYRSSPPNGTVAISATGELDRPPPSPRSSAPCHGTGTYELCCHPGYNDADLDLVTTRLRAHRDVERNALLSRRFPKHPLLNPPHPRWSATETLALGVGRISSSPT